MLDKRAEIIQEFQNRIEAITDNEGVDGFGAYIPDDRVLYQMWLWLDYETKQQVLSNPIEQLLNDIFESLSISPKCMRQTALKTFFGSYAEDYSLDELREMLTSEINQ